MSKKNNYDYLVDLIKDTCPFPRFAITKELFYFISSLTPMVNVDLLIKNNLNQTLLTWREDKFYGPGWHIPGGIVRFKEKFLNRINIVAMKELGMKVSSNKEPILVKEIFNEQRDIRGHFISHLYRCQPLSNPYTFLEAKNNKLKNGVWRWHDSAPENLIPVQNFYKKYINER